MVEQVPADAIWNSTWSYSHTQLSLYRLCPRRYYERYVLPPPAEAQKESYSETMLYSAHVIHPGIESLHTLNSTFDLELSIAKFRADPRVSTKTNEWDLPLARSILESYKLNPIPGTITHVEKEARILVDDIVTGEKSKYQFLSKPDFVSDQDTTVDLKFTTSQRPYPLNPFDDQLLGQAIVFNKTRFTRYQICVDAKTMTLKDIVVEAWPVDPLLEQNWFERTVKTIRDIEESRRVNLWTEHEHACGAFNRVCPYKGSCVYGRIRL